MDRLTANDIDNMDIQDTIGLGITQDLEESIDLSNDLGSAVHSDWQLSTQLSLA